MLAVCTVASAQDAFDVLEFAVEGNTVLPVAAIERALMPFLGPGRGMAAVEDARATLDRAYQQAGFLTVFVDIPEQRIEDGVVRLQVTQGRVDRVRVVGSRYFSQGVIRDTVAEIGPGRTPDFNVVQRQLAELNRTADRRVQPVLRPGRTPGTVDIDLQVQDELPLAASAEINNRHPAHTAPLRLSASARYDNLWQRGHGIGITATTAPQHPDQSRQLLLNYTAPLPHEGQLAGFVAYSDSLVEPLSAVTVAGKGVDVGLRYSFPLPPLPDFVHSLILGVDYKRYRTNTVDGDSGVLTPLRYLPFQLGYAADLVQAEGSTSLNTQIVVAQRGLLQRDFECAGVGRSDQFACSARDTDGSFGYWRGELRHTRQAWARSTLAVKLGWQFSPEPLVSNERYAVGGVDTVRGYLDAEGQGDRAWLASLQWRTPDLFGSNAAAYAFFDAAQVEILNALAEQPARQSLRGVGFGLQWRSGKTLSGQLDVAWPLLRTNDTPQRDPRLHVRFAIAL